MATTLQAQDRRQRSEVENTARATLEILRYDGLIVRVPTNTRKINAMRAFLDTSALSTPNRSRLEERLETTIKETEAEAQALVQALRNQYTIGPLYFVPDTVFSLLQRTEGQGFFLNDERQIDPSIVRPINFVTLTLGNTDLATGSGAEAFLLQDRDLKPLLPPLPDAITLNNLGYLFNQILTPDIAQRKRIEGAVNRLVKRLRRLMADYQIE